MPRRSSAQRVLWNSDQGAGARQAAESSLDKLGLDALDLYLIHWPAPANELYLRSWTALEELAAAGRSRAIGVSNFLPEHLERVIALGGTVPAVNQIELHPALRQAATVALHAAHGIATEAWSPLAQGAMLSNPVIVRLAEAIGRTPAQLILRWHLQQGRIVIPSRSRRRASPRTWPCSTSNWMPRRSPPSMRSSPPPGPAASDRTPPSSTAERLSAPPPAHSAPATRSHRWPLRVT